MRLKPGEFLPLDDPQRDVQMVQWSGSPIFGQNEEALLYQYFERLTGISDLALGRQPNRVGATRTATGVSSLLSEAGLRFKTTMVAFQRWWIGIFEDVLALDQQYLPPGKEFRVTGKSPELIRMNDRSEIMGRFDLRLAASSESLNRQLLREDATVKLNTLLNPVLLQLGLVGMKGIDRLLRRYVRAYGDDPDLILEPQSQTIIRTPEEELQMILSGQAPEPSIAENIGQHVQTHSQQLANPVVKEQLGPEGLARLQRHLSQTVQLAQIQQVIQSQQRAAPGGGGRPGAGSPVAGQQAMNAQIGREAATGPPPPGGNGMLSAGGRPGGPGY